MSDEQNAAGTWSASYFGGSAFVIVQLSTPLLLPVARAELQIENFANMSAFSGTTAVFPLAKTAQLALVFVKEKNKGLVL